MGRSTRLAIGAVAAAFAAGHLAPSHLGAAVAFACAALLLVGETQRGRGVRAAWPIVVGAGLIAARIALTPAAPPVADVPPPGDGPWTLVVESTGSPREGQQTATLGTLPGVVPAFRLAATLPRYPTVTAGDRIEVSGAIRTRPDSSYGAYLERIGAVGTLSTHTLAIVKAPADPDRRLEELRRGAADALAQVLPEPEAGLAAGILIGLRDRVDRDLAGAFTTAGVSHVVAISGWNIAIVAAAVAAVAGRLGRRRRSVVTIAAIVVYVCFAGASPSVVRAALMAGVVLLARETGRAGRAAAALGWAAVLLLVSDPALLGDAGFQLSSLATAGLIAWATPLSDWLSRIGGGRLPRWLAESLGVSLAAQAATLPIVLASFGRLALLSPLVNLAVVPLVAPAMAAGVVALAGGAIALVGGPPVIGAVLAAPGWVILRVLVTIVDTAAGLPFASVTLPPPLDTLAAALATSVLIGITWWTRRPRRTSHGRALPAIGPPKPGSAATSAPSPGPGRRPSAASGRMAGRAAAGALTVTVLVAGAVVAARPTSSPRVSVLDVGQGDAILVEGSRGGRLLIDGGPDPDRLLVVLDQRIPPWDRRIDAVILSHPHEDHVAGLALLLARYHVDRVLEPGMRGPGPGYGAWVRALGVPGAPLRLGVGAGDRLVVDEISMRVLWPVRGRVPVEPPDGGTGINNVSVVLLGQIGSSRFLLMGDVEEGIDPALLADGLPRVDFLKVAHHGSKTATTEPFIEAVRPKVAVASAGAGNPYGHPSPVTLGRLAAAGARVLRTDRDGTVVATFANDGVSVRAEGGRSEASVAPPPPADARLARAGARLETAGRVPSVAARFLCAVPVTGLVPPEPRPPVSATGSGSDAPDVAAAQRGRAWAVGYHRADDGARAGGGRLPAALPRSPALVRAARTRRRRCGGLARVQDRGLWRCRRPAARRGRGPPPRCRQGLAARRSGTSPAAR